MNNFSLFAPASGAGLPHLLHESDIYCPEFFLPSVDGDMTIPGRTFTPRAAAVFTPSNRRQLNIHQSVNE